MATSSSDMTARAQLEAEILEVNASFYRAFTEGDLASMQALWASEAPLSCLHPGMPALAGREKVLDSWARILERPPPAPMICAHARVQLLGDTALVLCYEGSGDKPSHLAATNVFVREAGAWRLVHHHAGPLSRPILRQTAADLN
ncbi:MAG TPA: nuclear transport factor 2 family protein [Polyangiaceae bacterium]|nr:nuclear transport factor 2 family protein [Polyangiaceae bacterium]